LTQWPQVDAPLGDGPTWMTPVSSTCAGRDLLAPPIKLQVSSPLRDEPRDFQQER